MSLKIKLTVLILTVVLAIGGATAGVLIYSNQAENVAIGALTGVYDDLLRRDEINPIYNMLSKGSIYAEVSEMRHDGEDLLEGGTFKGKLYFSKDECAIMAEDVYVSVDDFEIDGDTYVSEELMYISESEILDGAYGLKFEDLADELDNSIFAYGSGSDFEIPYKELYEDILEALKEDNNEEMIEDFTVLFKDLIKDIWEIMCDNFSFSSETDTVRLNGEKEKARVVSIVIDKDAIKGFVSDFIDYILEDESIQEFLDEYDSKFTPLLSYFYYIEKSSIAERYEEILEDLEERQDEIVDDIDRNFDTVSIEIVTPRMSKKLLKLTCDIGGEELLSFDFGTEGIKKTEKISIELDGDEIIYKISENNSDEYNSELIVDGTTVLEVSVNKDKESYSVTLGEYNTTTIKGSILTERNETTITIDKIIQYRGYTGNSSTINTEITFVIDESDSMPSEPTDYDTLSDISEDDIYAWIEKID